MVARKSKISVAGVRALPMGKERVTGQINHGEKGKKQRNSIFWKVCSGHRGESCQKADDYFSASMLKLLGREKYY